MKKIFTILAVALFLGACHCTKCTRTACHMNKQATCACAQHKDGQCAAHKAGCKCGKCKKAQCQKHQGKACPCAKGQKAGCKCGKCKKAQCQKHQGKDCPCAKGQKTCSCGETCACNKNSGKSCGCGQHHPAPVAAQPAPAPKPVAKKVAEDQDLAAVGKVKAKEDNTAVFSFDKAINFKVNSDEIQGDSPKDIRQTAKALRKYPDAKVKVVGYTDSIGEADYNLDLSKRRAQAVADLLIKDGVPAANVTAIGMGENNPIASNNTAAGRAQNRRVEIEISNQ